MLNYLVNKLVAWAKTRPYFDLPGYMERWWIRKPKPGRNWTCRLHHILSSDNDRHLHDHPWPYVTIILRGGYWETRPTAEKNWAKDTVKWNGEFGPAGSWVERKWRGPGSILIRKPNSYHQLTLPEGKTALTMFWMGPHTQHWGFMTPTGKIYWREYLNDWTGYEPGYYLHQPRERIQTTHEGD